MAPVQGRYGACTTPFIVYFSIYYTLVNMWQTYKGIGVRRVYRAAMELVPSGYDAYNNSGKLHNWIFKTRSIALDKRIQLLEPPFSKAKELQGFGCRGPSLDQDGHSM